MKTISDVTLCYLVEKLLGKITGSEEKLTGKLTGSEEKLLERDRQLTQALRDHLDDKNNPHAVQFSQLAGKALLDAVYPVGSIYMSTRSASPASLFGGSWTRIQDRFLLAAGSGYTAGTTGGAAAHTLTEQQMPRHTHMFHIGSHGSALDGPFDKTRTALKFDYQSQYAKGSVDGSIVRETGGAESFPLMPPYVAVYVWQRTA